jgi:hypothetical protein
MSANVKRVRDELIEPVLRGFAIIFGTLAPVVERASAPVTVDAASAQNITVAQLLSGWYRRDCAGGNRTDTTEAGENLEAGLAQRLGRPLQNGDRFEFWVHNISAGAHTLTLAGGTGVTVQGTATAAQNTVHAWVAVRTAADTFIFCRAI